MSTLQMMPLPALRLSVVRATVLDETEIPRAAREVVARLRPHLTDGAEDVVLTYDGTSEDVIVVAAGVEGELRAPEVDVVEVPGVADGVSVRFEEPPADVGDAWIALDSQLERRGLRTAGVYRQLISPDGSVTLQAGVRPLP
jgi:hypothetical protein